MTDSPQTIEVYSSDVVFINGGDEYGIYLCADDAETLADLITGISNDGNIRSMVIRRLERLLRDTVEPQEVLVLQVEP